VGDDGVDKVILGGTTYLFSTFLFFEECNGQWYLNGADLQVNDSLELWSQTAQYPADSLYDLRSFLKQAVGVSHLIAPTNDPQNISNYKLWSGNVQRVPGPADIWSSQYIVDQSVVASGCTDGPLEEVIDCAFGPSLDAGISDVLTPLSGSCAGVQPVIIRLRAPGLTPVTSATIEWSVDGNAQTPYLWTGNILHGDTSATITIGTFPFTMTGHVLTINLALVNGANDMEPGNDTWGKPISFKSCNPIDIYRATYYEPRDQNCPEHGPVRCEFGNPGPDTLFTAVFKWSLNSVEKNAIAWSDTLLDSERVDIDLGSYTDLQTGDTIRVWVEYPNGLIDTYQDNDSAQWVYNNATLNGTYTIGGASPDFATFSDAEIALHNGICGPVVFEVRPGTYPEDLELNTYPGTSENVNITFRSENGDSSSVELYSSWTTPLTFSNAGFINFERIKIFQDGDHNNEHGITLTGSCHDISIVGCLVTTDNNSGFHRAIYGEGDRLWIQGCNLIGSGRISIENGTELHILDCQLSVDQGIFVENYEDLQISNNELRTGPLIVRDCTGDVCVDGNRTTVCVVEDCYFDDAQPMRFQNNIIHFDVNALRLLNCHNLDVLHNTIVQEGASSPTAEVVKMTSTNVRFMNNIVANYGDGEVMTADLVNTQAGFTADHNIYFTTGAFFASNGATIMNDLSHWVTSTGQDVNSRYLDLDLDGQSYPSLTHSALLELALGNDPNIGVYSDIDSRPRGGIVTPGAEQIVRESHDLGVLGFGGGDVLCNGVQSIPLLVANHGLQPISGMALNWYMNGSIMPQVIWTGSLASGDSLTLPLPPQLFTGGSVALSASVDSIWGQYDQVSWNDSIAVSKGVGGYSGTYTVGGASPNFTSISAAFAALENSGICGSVILDVRPGQYSAQVVVDAIPGTSLQRRITLRSENGDSTQVEMFLATNDPALTLSGISHLDIERVTIGGTGLMIEGSEDVTVRGCIVQGGVFAGGNDLVFINDSITGDLFNESVNGLTYSNIEVLSCAARFILLEHTTGLSIEECSIRRIYLEHCATAGIERNWLIDSVSFGTAIWINNCQHEVTAPLRIKNNYVYGNYQYFIKFQNFGTTTLPNENSEIQHNTVHLFGDAYTLISTFNMNGTTRLENNIFHVGYVLWFISGNSEFLNGFVSRNNIYHADSSGTDFIFYHGVLASGASLMNSLESWQLYSGKEQGSLDLDVGLDAADPFPHGGWQIDEAGIATGVQEDILGEPRDLQMPDIGALEFTMPQFANDLAVVSTDPTNVECAGVPTPIFCVLKNFGNTSITSAMIGWSIDGIAQTSFSWNGNLSPGQSSSAILLGNYTFSGAAAQELMVWSSLPNGTVDPQLANDTLIHGNVITIMSGDYTIGSILDDYITIQQAAFDVSLRGVCGPVRFIIKPGIYSAGFELSAIQGSSYQDSVSFVSSSGIPDDVIIEDANVSGEALTLRYAGHLRFQGLTFISHSNGDDLIFADGAVDVSFRNCRFTADQGYGFRSAILIGPNGVDSLWLVNCEVDHFANFIKDYGINSGSSELRVIDCKVWDISSALFDLTDVEHIEVGHCELTGLTTNDPVANIDGGTDIVFHDNVIDKCRLRIRSGSTIGNDSVWLYNNAISNDKQSLLIQFRSNVSLLHNSIRTSVGSQANSSIYSTVHIREVRDLTMKNNVFMHAGSSPPMAIGNLMGDHNSDHNVMHSLGGVFGLATYGSQVFYDSLTFSQHFGTDSNSMSINPLFVSPIDLHVLEPALAAAMPIPWITTDFEGDPRAPNNPLIGADESTFLSLDVKMVDLEIPQLCEGSNVANVEFRNNGITTLTSVELYLEVNGSVQPVYNWTGSLSPGVLSQSIPLSFQGNIGTSYSIRVWSSDPNGANDMELTNDTLIDQQIHFPRLHGLYTVGDLNSDYPTLTDAVSDLNDFGICGDVEFAIIDGIETGPFHIMPIPGWQAGDSIVLSSVSQDSSAVFIEASGSIAQPFVFRLENDQIHFRHLTIRALDEDHPGVIETVATVYTTFDSCHFIVPAEVDNGATIPMCKGTVSTRSVEYRYCTFSNGKRAIEWGSALGGFASLNIKNCTFEQQVGNSIYLYNSGSFTIADNDFYPANDTSSIAILLIDESWSSVQIVARNRIHDINGTGIYCRSAGVLIKNNYVSVYSDPNTAGPVAALIVEEDNVEVFNNTFISSGSVPNSAPTVKWLDRDLELKNNIIISEDSSAALLIVPVPFAQLDSDHNCFWSPDVLIDKDGFLHQDLVLWRQQTGNDQNSFVYKPTFVAPGDPHIEIGFPLKDAGDDDLDVYYDIDLEWRQNNPDIGADEFPPAPVEFGALSLILEPHLCDSMNLLVSFRNNGSDPLTEVDLNYTVNGGPVSTVNWQGSLATNQYIYQLNISTEVIAQNVLHEVVLWGSNPNGVMDPWPVNDTVSNDLEVILPTLDLGPDATICPDAVHPLIVDPNFVHYNWSNGDTTSTTIIDQASTVWLTVIDDQGCSVSDTIIVQEYVVIQPIITVSGNNLTSSANSGNQWFLNGAPIIGAVGPIWTVMVNGAYHVLVTDVNGCISSSDTLLVGWVGIEDQVNNELSWWSTETQGLIVQFPLDISGEVEYTVYDAIGKTILSSSSLIDQNGQLEIDRFGTTGVYVVDLIDKEGKQWVIRSLRSR